MKEVINTLLGPALQTAEEIGRRGVGAAKILIWGIQSAQAEPVLSLPDEQKFPIDQVIHGVPVVHLHAGNTDIYAVREGPVTGPHSESDDVEAVLVADSEADSDVIGLGI